MDAIYLALDGRQQGPFTLEQVRAAVARGDYPSATPAWHEGLAEWTPLVRLLDAALPATVPLPPVPAEALPVNSALSAAPDGLSITRDQLREIARRQNLLMWSLLAAVVGNICIRLAAVGVLVWLGAAIFEVYALYTLGRSLRVRAAWAYCILLFLPLVGLIVLYFFSQKATRVLKEHGIPVGLMGAKAADIP